jgi:hypothetical protein
MGNAAVTPVSPVPSASAADVVTSGENIDDALVSRAYQGLDVSSRPTGLMSQTTPFFVDDVKPLLDLRLSYVGPLWSKWTSILAANGRVVAVMPATTRRMKHDEIRILRPVPSFPGQQEEQLGDGSSAPLFGFGRIVVEKHFNQPGLAEYAVLQKGDESAVPRYLAVQVPGDGMRFACCVQCSVAGTLVAEADAREWGRIHVRIAPTPTGEDVAALLALITALAETVSFGMPGFVIGATTAFGVPAVAISTAVSELSVAAL